MSKDIKELEKWYKKVSPEVDKLRAKYPKECNIDGFEPALTNDIAEIVAKLVSSLRKELCEKIERMKLDPKIYPDYAGERNKTIKDITNLIKGE